MKISEALEELKKAFPTRSIKVGLDVWYWVHCDPPETDPEWNVSIVDEEGYFKGKSLEAVVKMALDHKADRERMAETEKSVDLEAVNPPPVQSID